MTKEKKKVESIGLNNLAGLDGIDLSGGYICDVETGICGPADEEMKNEPTEEKKNENNSMV